MKWDVGMQIMKKKITRDCIHPHPYILVFSNATSDSLWAILSQ